MTNMHQHDTYAEHTQQETKRLKCIGLAAGKMTTHKKENPKGSKEKILHQAPTDPQLPLLAGVDESQVAAMWGT